MVHQPFSSVLLGRPADKRDARLQAGADVAAFPPEELELRTYTEQVGRRTGHRPAGAEEQIVGIDAPLLQIRDRAGNADVVAQCILGRWDVLIDAVLVDTVVLGLANVPGRPVDLVYVGHHPLAIEVIGFLLALELPPRDDSLFQIAGRTVGNALVEVLVPHGPPDLARALPAELDDVVYPMVDVGP